MRQHLRLIGIFHIVWGFLNMVGAVAMILVYFGVLGVAGGVGATQVDGPDQGGALAWIVGILAGIGLVAGCGLLAPSLPGFVGGIGLLRYRPWARWLLIVVSVVYLFYFPLGTAVGAYSLWVLFHADAEQALFTGPD